MLGKNKIIIILFFIAVLVLGYFVINKMQNRDKQGDKADITAMPKWAFPSKEMCMQYGGKLPKNGICEANWENANKICKATDMELPPLEELKNIVTGCGGVLQKNTKSEDEWNKNRTNKSYHACYRKEGFNSSLYWSANTNVKYSTSAWMLYFNTGGEYSRLKKLVTSVRCYNKSAK